MSDQNFDSSASARLAGREAEEHFGLVHAVAGAAGSRRRLAAFSVAGVSFLLVIFGTALFDLAHYDHEDARRIFERADVEPTRDRIMDGQWIRFFETQISDASFARRHATVLWSQALYRHLRIMTKGFARGAGDWVFHAPRNQLHPLATSSGIESFARECKDLAAKLAERGTKLHIALIPRKGLVAAEHLGALKLEGPELEREILEALRRNGLSAPDLVTPLCSRPADEVWCLQDTHWTPEGARRAAEALIQQVELFAPQALRSLLQFAPSSTNSHIGDTIYGSGLLDRALPHEWESPQSLRTPVYVLAGEKVVFDHHRQFEVRDQKLWLAGTSFSNCFGAFPRALEHYSGQSLASFPAPAEGPYVGLQRAMARASAAQRWPEHLVWEIPAFYLVAQPPGDQAPHLQVRRLAAALTLDQARDLAEVKPLQAADPKERARVALSLTKRRFGTWLGFVPTGTSIVTDGRGMLRYHLQRKSASRPLRVRLIGKDLGQEIRWENHSEALDIPVISAEPTTFHRLDVEISDAEAHAQLASVSVRISCRFPEPTAFQEPTRHKANALTEEVASLFIPEGIDLTPTSALVLVDMAKISRAVEPLIRSVVAYTDSGPLTVFEAQETPIHSGRVILISFAALAGRKVYGVELVASDAGRTFEGYSAAIAN